MLFSLKTSFKNELWESAADKFDESVTLRGSDSNGSATQSWTFGVFSITMKSKLLCLMLNAQAKKGNDDGLNQPSLHPNADHGMHDTPDALP